MGARRLGGRHTASPNGSAAPRSPQQPERAAPARRAALLAAGRSRSSARCCSDPIGQTVYYSFTHWDGLTATWVGTAHLLAPARQPRLPAGAREQRDPGARDPDRDRLPLGVAFLLSSHLPRLALLPLGVLPADCGLVGRDRRDRRALLRRRGDPAAPAGHSRASAVLHPDMLSHEHSALVAVMITFIWAMFGTNLIIFLAGMATIDAVALRRGQGRRRRPAARARVRSRSRCCAGSSSSPSSSRWSPRSPRSSA